MTHCSICPKALWQHRGEVYYLLLAGLFVLVFAVNAKSLSISQWDLVLFFAASITILDSRLVKLSRHRVGMTMVSAVLLAESTNLGAFAVLCSLAISYPFLLLRYRANYKFAVLFNMSQYGLASSLGFFAYRAFGGTVGSYHGSSWALPGYVLAYVMANFLFVIIAFLLKEQESESANFLTYILDFQTLVLYLIIVIIGILMGYVFQSFHAMGVAVLMAALWLLARSYQKYFQVAHEARTDVLTGLLNRQGLQTELAHRIKRGTAFSVLMIDLDHFKRINDSLGHLNGDKVIEAISQLLIHEVGSNGIVSRYGGEEFCALIFGGVEQAYVLSESLRRAIYSWNIGGLGLPALQGALDVRFGAYREVNREPQGAGHLNLSVSASIGIAAFPQHGHNYETLLEHADQALYEAKAERNRVVIYSQSVKPQSV